MRHTRRCSDARSADKGRIRRTVLPFAGPLSWICRPSVLPLPAACVLSLPAASPVFADQPFEIPNFPRSETVRHIVGKNCRKITAPSNAHANTISTEFLVPLNSNSTSDFFTCIELRDRPSRSGTAHERFVSGTGYRPPLLLLRSASNVLVVVVSSSSSSFLKHLNAHSRRGIRIYFHLA